MLANLAKKMPNLKSAWLFRKEEGTLNFVNKSRKTNNETMVEAVKVIRFESIVEKI